MSTFSESPPAPVHQLLIVEDDERVRDLLVEGFELDGYRVSHADSLDVARQKLETHELDLVLLDVNLPDGTGYALLRDLREGRVTRGGRRLVELPVMMVSGRAAEHDRLRGFEFGCDDYIAKPYSFGELRARVGALLRRRRAQVAPLGDLGELEIDSTARLVRLNGRSVRLTLKEFTLLTVLAQEPTRVFTRAELLEAVWGYRSTSSTRTLDAHACRLRAKLTGGEQTYVINTWGVGYRLLGMAPEVEA
jgi:DNA-binding response OmpR family regulator